MLKNQALYHFNNNLQDQPLRFSDFNVMQIGRLFCKYPYIMKLHPHGDIFEITIVNKGAGNIITNGQETKVFPGDIYISCPNEFHEIRTVKDQVLEYDFLAFNFPSDSKFFHAYEEIALFNRDYDNRVFRDDKIAFLVKNALSEFNEEKKYDLPLLECIFQQICTYILRNFKKSERKIKNLSSADVLCYQIMNYIDSHIYTMKSLEDISKNFNYNYSYLSTVFKKNTQKNLRQYYFDQKLETAKLLVLEDKKNMEEIANLLHYSNSFSFSKAFKSKFGISPMKMRTTARKNTLK